MTRGGFTLVDVMVGVILTGVTVLLAHAVVVSVGDSASTLSRALAVDAREAHWRDRVRQRMQLLSDDARAGGFHGDSLSCSFGTLEDRANAAERWTILRRADSLFLTAGNGEVSSSLDGVVSHHVEYLEAPGSRRPWLIYWDSPATAPRAVRLRWRRAVAPTAEDTLILLTGADG